MYYGNIQYGWIVITYPLMIYLNLKTYEGRKIIFLLDSGKRYI